MKVGCKVWAIVGHGVVGGEIGGGGGPYRNRPETVARGARKRKKNNQLGFIAATTNL